MKRCSLFVFLSIFILAAQLNIAQVVLDPGDDILLTNNSATSGQAGNNNNVTFTFASDYNLNTKTIRASADANTTAFGTGTAFALLNYDFQISQTPGTMNNTVGAWISYDAAWKGLQLILSVALSNSSVNVEMTLRDLTENKIINRETIHDLDLQSQKVKFVNVGFDFDDSGTKINTFPAVLKRGHDYRLTFRLTAILQKYLLLAAEASSSDYYSFNGGAELKYLHVKVGLDEKETLQTLAKIDSLENKIDEIEYKLENHSHVYLTGRGTGHNNTEANTTLSIFEDGKDDMTRQLLLKAKDAAVVPAEEVSLPDDFSLNQNHPNPFNPSTRISFALPEQELVKIKVFDILGREIAVLLNDIKNPGYHEILFNADTLPSGTYIYEIRAGNYVESKKMILLK